MKLGIIQFPLSLRIVLSLRYLIHLFTWKEVEGKGNEIDVKLIRQHNAFGFFKTAAPQIAGNFSTLIFYSRGENVTNYIVQFKGV